MNLEGSSQTRKTNIPDTLCFPVHIVQDRLIEAKQGRQLKPIVDSLKKENSLMEKTIFKQTQGLSLLERDLKREREIVDLQQANINDYKKRDSLSAAHIQSLNKQVKRANTKTVAVGILGATLLVLALLK